MTGDWIQNLSNFLTLATVTATIVIAGATVTAVRISRRQLKQDLFDKRFAVFEATRKCTCVAFTHGKIDKKETDGLYTAVISASFLFDEDMTKYIQNICKKSFHIKELQDELKNNFPSGRKKKEINDEKKQLLQELRDAHCTLQKEFSPFLKLNH